MSVDDRLREAFGETDRSWDEQVPTAMAALAARHRHERALRRGVTASLTAAAAVTVLVMTLSQGDEGRDTPTHNPTQDPSPTPAQPTGTNPLHGTWVSEPFTPADVRRAARLSGDASDADAMLAELPPLPFRVVIYVNGDRSSLHSTYRRPSGPEENADEETVTVTEDRLVMQPMFAEGESVHTWVLDGGRLRFTFVSTTEGEVGGVPAEAWQRLLYDTAAFTSGT